MLRRRATAAFGEASHKSLIALFRRTTGHNGTFGEELFAKSLSQAFWANVAEVRVRFPCGMNRHCTA